MVRSTNGKALAIRAYLQSHPNGTPAEVVSGLAEQGTRVNAKLVVIVVGQIAAAARLRRSDQSRSANEG